jgi:hypothetical protein
MVSINAIIVWNTRYYQAIGDRLGGISAEVWAHISPMSWEHIQFVGSYSFDELALDGDLRPLLLEQRHEDR